MKKMLSIELSSYDGDGDGHNFRCIAGDFVMNCFR